VVGRVNSGNIASPPLTASAKFRRYAGSRLPALAIALKQNTAARKAFELPGSSKRFEASKAEGKSIRNAEE
jgi:hypothetical protein